jgi:hypothetical protein
MPDFALEGVSHPGISCALQAKEIMEKFLHD